MVCCGRNPALAMCVAYGVERIATEPAHLPPTRLPEDAAVETDVHRLRLLCRGTFEGKVKDLCCLLFSYATLFFFCSWYGCEFCCIGCVLSCIIAANLPLSLNLAFFAETWG